MASPPPSKRPVFFEPLKTALPITALVSITHRLSGLALVLALPVVLMGLSCSLTSPATFLLLQQRLTSCPLTRFFVFGVLTAWIFHAFAGVRHLLMDAHFFEQLPAARLTAQAVVVFSTAVISFIGGWLLWV